MINLGRGSRIRGFTFKNLINCKSGSGGEIYFLQARCLGHVPLVIVFIFFSLASEKY